MKKKIFTVLLILSFAFFAGGIFGVRRQYYKEPKAEPDTVEELLTYSDWADEEGRALKFGENSEGELDGRAFSWKRYGDELELNYLPHSGLSREHELKISDKDGQLTLSLGERHFTRADRKMRQEREKESRILELGQEIADFACEYEGSKYRYGGRSPETGFDCSGLVCYVYDNFGYSLQRIASEQAKQGKHVEPEELIPGDVLCFYTSGKYIGHVGIYIGDGNYIHAMGSAYGVRIDSLDDPFLKREFEARRMTDSPELLKENKQ